MFFKSFSKHLIKVLSDELLQNKMKNSSQDVFSFQDSFLSSFHFNIFGLQTQINGCNLSCLYLQDQSGVSGIKQESIWQFLTHCHPV